MTQEIMIQMKDKMNLITDIGISIEIKDFFRGCENVETFNIKEDMVYKVSIKLNRFSLFESKKIFSSFLHFIEYSSGSFYLRKIYNEEIIYSLLTFDDDFEGFYCELEFKWLSFNE